MQANQKENVSVCVYVIGECELFNVNEMIEEA